MSEALVYFELRPEIGAHPDEQLRAQVVPVTVPVMVGKEVGQTTEPHIIQPRPKLDRYPARVIPETRIVEARHPLIVQWFAADERYRPCNPPTKQRVDKQQRAARDWERQKHAQFAPERAARQESTTTAKEQ